MRFRIAMTALLLLAGCGSGGTTGTNYSDPPPEAEIVATPSASPSATPDAARENEGEGTTPTSSVDPASGLPADVAAYVRKRDSCAHWRGEEATDDARRKEIADAVARDCTGLDDELKRLRGSYMPDEKVQAALDSETD